MNCKCLYAQIFSYNILKMLLKDHFRCQLYLQSCVKKDKKLYLNRMCDYWTLYGKCVWQISNMEELALSSNTGVKEEEELI